MKRQAGGKILRSAFSLDRRGREAEAIPLYRQALRLGLKPSDRRDAMICLGSSLRNVGQLQSSLRCLRNASRQFPDDPVIALFMALVHHDLGQKTTALRLAAKACLNQNNQRRLRPYRDVLLRKCRQL
ncbi:MAG TPA: tetratricopeptide repeat protein [Tepidisphaeraceae bacterium]|nr:tetratricopeptide repeat protein [Tepidisphaeraceae bacterium]